MSAVTEPRLSREASPISRGRHRLCIAVPQAGIPSETFIRAHIERLPCQVRVVSGTYPYCVDEQGRPIVVGQGLVSRAYRRLLAGQSATLDVARVAQYLRHIGAEAVLAEFGPMGADLAESCRRAGIPLVVHFHGYDASQHDCLEQYERKYQTMFEIAARVICVSRHMQAQLLRLGAPQEKLVLNPYGVDLERFSGAAPERAAPVFAAVGRLVEKKAPHLTLLAFDRVRQVVPDARLVMIGDGPLSGVCAQIVRAMGLTDAVELLGLQKHTEVAARMRAARCFVQHSLTASNGDSEGTPVAVLEAGAMGLPVVATRHAGIPDVVVEGETGLLVEEGDVAGMAEGMLQLAKDPMLAGRMGKAASARVAAEFSMERSIGRLWEVLEQAIQRR